MNSKYKIIYFLNSEVDEYIYLLDKFSYIDVVCLKIDLFIDRSIFKI